MIYFYAPREMKVRAAVDFPSGLITEWYPRARAMAGGSIDWGEILVQPRDGGPLAVWQRCGLAEARQVERDHVALGGEPVELRRPDLPLTPEPVNQHEWLAAPATDVVERHTTQSVTAERPSAFARVSQSVRAGAACP